MNSSIIGGTTGLSSFRSHRKLQKRVSMVKKLNESNQRGHCF